MGNCSLAQRLRLIERGWIDAQSAVDSKSRDQAGEEDEKESLTENEKAVHA